uniref:Uncharacterized protein n=1 Tax=Oryza rufipogon TaxID=4529 RepID=A0A0E0Q3H5_ORYRU
MDFSVRARIQSPHQSAAHFVAGESVKDGSIIRAGGEKSSPSSDGTPAVTTVNQPEMRVNRACIPRALAAACNDGPGPLAQWANKFTNLE